MNLGTWTPFVAYVISCFGCALGLLSTERARSVRGATRRGWLVLGAASIGGTGIWVMHFVAMLGMTMPGTTMDFELPGTMLSMVVAIVVVGVGLFVVDAGGGRPSSLLVGGLFTGLGVAGMHYLGMAAMRLQGTVRYNPTLVVLSVVIAVVAATAALWATRTVRGPQAVGGAALVMGLAVTGMHYTGIAAMTVTLDSSAPPTVSVTSSVLIVLVIMGVSVVSVLTVFMLVLSPGLRETEEETRLSL